MPKNKTVRWTGDRYDPSIIAQLFVSVRQFRIIEREYLVGEDLEEDTQIVLTINPIRRGIDLTNYTIEELDAFRAFVLEAVEMARPICATRDAAAEAARKRNDVRFKRLWRAKPKYYNFRKNSDAHPRFNIQVLDNPDEPGIQSEHDPSVQVGPTGIAEDGARPAGDELRTDGGDLPQRGETGGCT